MNLNNVEIMSTGEWNGVAVTDGTLGALKHSFDALGLAGKIPLKIGHDGADARDDGLAMGWVQRLTVKGRKLFADLTDIPEHVFNLIKSKALKFCSIEMLRGVEANGKKHDAVLDAVALLGASRPAVTDLAPLMAARKAAGVVCERIECFSTDFAAPADDPERVDFGAERREFARKLRVAEAATTAEKARADAAVEQFAAYQRAQDCKALKDEINAAIRSGKLKPAAGHVAIKRLEDPKQSFSRDDLSMLMLAGDSQRFSARVITGSMRTADGGDPGSPAAALIEAGKARFAAQPLRAIEGSTRLRPEKDFIQCCVEAARSSPELRADAETMVTQLFRQRPR